MKDWWLKFGCFLTGFNYSLVKNSSEQSSKNVKKYTSAMELIVLLWLFIGYSLAIRYLDLAPWAGIVGGVFLGFVILQTARFILLSTKIGPWSGLCSMLLWLVMSIL